MVHKVGHDRLAGHVAHAAELGVQVRHAGRCHRQEAATDALAALEQAHHEGTAATPPKLLQHAAVPGFRPEQPPGGIRPGNPGTDDRYVDHVAAACRMAGLPGPRSHERSRLGGPRRSVGDGDRAERHGSLEQIAPRWFAHLRNPPV